MLKKFGGLGVALVVGLVILALKLGAGFGIGFLSAKASAPDVGDCVTVGGTATDADVDKADCDDDDVLYKVVGDDGDCDSYEVEYTVEVTGADAADLCLYLNVEAGDCIRVPTDDIIDAELVDCTSTKGEKRVLRIDSFGKSADATCKPRQALVDKKRDLALCASPNA
ncbi:hypothetical protein [Nocardioides sp. MH1]|uniref:LppU/SCO3897 family protein n=1 Tax=Nocardioides sp. MH1 TaxID=3242490 RepID=UPI00352122DE